jgi:hypothetical protein
MKTLLTAVCFAGMLMAAGGDAMKPAVDNERVRVWDVVWTKGQPGPIQKYELDTVKVFIAGGDIRVKNADGSTKVVTRKKGEAVFVPQGAAFTEEGASDTPAHSVIVELKNNPVEPLKNDTGLPNAFPRPHVKKVMENKRVLVWDYEWYPNQPTPMHFHDKDVVVTYMEDGSLQSTTPDGQKTVNDYHAGQIRYNERKRTHTELLIKGTQHAMMVELK